MRARAPHPASRCTTRSLLPEHRQPLREIEVRWACRRARLHRLGPHYLLMGTPGSGKTTLQKILMKTLLPAPDHRAVRRGDGTGHSVCGLNFRAAIYDPKQEFYPFLVQIGVPEEQIIVTHPYDTRSSAWHLPADFRDRGHAATLASALIPLASASHHGHNGQREADFWTNAANQTLFHVIEGLMLRSPDDWDLRDITEACATPETLYRIMWATEDGADSYRYYFESGGRLAMDVLATLRSKVFEYSPLAALWQRASHSFSLAEWHRGSGVLLIGSDQARSGTLNKLNTLLIRRMAETVLQREERPDDLTWLFFDELTEAGEFPRFASFLRAGRSKGVRCVLGFQDIAGMNRAFGSDQTQELVSLCVNKAILNLGSPEAMEWASRLFAQREELVASNTHDELHRSRSRTESRQLVTQVLPTQFHELKLAENEHGAIEGYFHHPGPHGKFHAQLPAQFVQTYLAPDAQRPLPAAFIERPASEQNRIRWTEQDLTRLGLAARPGTASERPRPRGGLRSLIDHPEDPDHGP